jgi:hypothetical protein
MAHVLVPGIVPGGVSSVIASDKNKPAAPDVLKVMWVKNFSTQAKFGIMSEVSEII